MRKECDRDNKKNIKEKKKMTEITEITATNVSVNQTFGQ